MGEGCSAALEGEEVGGWGWRGGKGKEEGGEKRREIADTPSPAHLPVSFSPVPDRCC